MNEEIPKERKAGVNVMKGTFIWLWHHVEDDKWREEGEYIIWRATRYSAASTLRAHGARAPQLMPIEPRKSRTYRYRESKLFLNQNYVNRQNKIKTIEIV